MAAHKNGRRFVRAAAFPRWIAATVVLAVGFMLWLGALAEPGGDLRSPGWRGWVTVVLLAVVAIRIASGWDNKMSAKSRRRQIHMDRQKAILIGISGVLLCANASAQPAPAYSATVNLPAGAAVRLEKPSGMVHVTGWDRADAEIRIVQTMGRAKKPGNALFSHRLDGKELVITTAPRRPRRIGWLRPSSFVYDYVISMPKSASLTVVEAAGAVNVEDVSGPMHITVSQGQILLRLPEAPKSVDAKSTVGGVVSDFEGAKKHEPWLFGSRIQSANKSAQSLRLRVLVGDIIILKMRQPPLPESKTL